MTVGGRAIAVLDGALARVLPWGLRKLALWAPAAAFYAANMNRFQVPTFNEWKMFIGASKDRYCIYVDTYE